MRVSIERPWRVRVLWAAMAFLAAVAAAPVAKGQGLILESFDGAWTADPDGDPHTVPAGWDIDGLCSAAQADEPAFTHYWSRFDNSVYPLIRSAPYCAGLCWSDGSGGDPADGSQDEWLIGPEVDASEAVNLRLVFYSCYTMSSSGPAPSAHDYVQVSTDSGSTWEIAADLCHDNAYYFEGASGGPGGTGWNWNEFPPQVDLGAYDGSPSLTIAFHYLSDGEAPRGLWTVDDVTLAGLEPLIVTGPGEGPDNVSDVHGYTVNDYQRVVDFGAYGVDRYGVNVATGDFTGVGSGQILTGAGPGAVFGPHVRAFSPDGTQLPGASFLAYGTHKFGVNVAAADIDGDGFDEILTGAGPGAVFGPHVRGWDYDGGSSVAPIPGVSFLAYGTHKWGVNVAGGDVDGDGYDEILAGAGPGAVFGPHLRGWNVDGGAVSAIPGISFLAYGTHKWGVNVACGDVDGDGIDELITGAGPGAVFGPHLRGWNYDGTELTAIAAVNLFAFGYTQFGVNVGCADLDRDGIDEILAGAGPGPEHPPLVRAFNYDGAAVSQIVDFEAYDGLTITHGVNVAGGLFVAP